MKTPCPSCGAEVPVLQESLVMECPFCACRLFVDLGRSVLHYRMEPVLTDRHAREALATQLAARDLAALLKLPDVQLLYLPFWCEDADSRTKLRAAAALVPSALVALAMPAGDLKYFDPDEAAGGTVVLPDHHRAASGKEKPPLLVHLPFYRLTYRSEGKTFEAHVDAASGRLLADEWPVPAVTARDSTFFFVLGTAAVAFLLEALFIPSGAVAAVAIAVTTVPLGLAARRVLERKP